MNCPYCDSPGFPRTPEVYSGDNCDQWVCVKCPNPVTYHAHEKKVSIWVLYNKNWYSIVYMKNKQEYVVHQESFELRTNQEQSREEYAYDGSFTLQLPSEETLTPTNAAEKLALWLTFS